MSTVDNRSSDEPKRLELVVLGAPVVNSALQRNVAAEIRALKDQIARLRRRAETANDESRGQIGYAIHRANMDMSRLRSTGAAVHEGIHTVVGYRVANGHECSVCSCGALAPGRLGRDYSLDDFRKAIGHLDFEEPDQDPMLCPRCGRSRPNDRDPGSRPGFWSRTIQRGYVCDGCHDHQMAMGYSPESLGDEDWPIEVPRRYYDESWWPRGAHP